MLLLPSECIPCMLNALAPFNPLSTFHHVDATSAPQLMQYLLPVVGSTPALRLSAKGVEALSDCFITDHEQLSADALAQLQQQVPSSQWGEGLEMALSQVRWVNTSNAHFVSAHCCAVQGAHASGIT